MKKLFVVLATAGASIAACSNDKLFPPVGTVAVASVTVLPTLDSVQSGDSMLKLRTVQLQALLQDAGGHVISAVQTGETVVWTSADPTLVPVDRYGVVSGAAPGTATITAAIGGKSNTSSIKDNAVTVGTVTVKPATDSVAVDATVTLKAIIVSTAGDTLAARKMFWTSSDTTVAFVANADSLNVAPGQSGTIQGVKTGTVTITATIGGVSGTATMKVIP